MKRNILAKNTLDKVTALYEKIENKFLFKLYDKKLSNKNFTIISNNCWGGHVYRWFGMPYLSPTVGLYFFADDYITFISYLREFLNQKLDFIDAKDSKYYKLLTEKHETNIPIGKLVYKEMSVEIMFLHYKTRKEAIEKWERRLSRVNYNNLIVKFSEMNLCNEKHLKTFQELKYEKKVLFLAKPHKGIKGNIIKRYSENGVVIDDTTYFNKQIDLISLINIM